MGGQAYRKCFCAFCKKPRRVFVKKHLSWIDLILLILFTTTLTFIIWQQAEPKGVLIFMTFVVIAESVIQVRWRMGMTCGSCGFDPLIYIRDPQRAAQKVRDFYEERKAQPDFLLTGQKLIETQKRLMPKKRNSLAKSEAN